MEIAQYASLELSGNEKKNLDIRISQLIHDHKRNRARLSKFSAECVALTTASEARSQSLVQQGVVSRFLGLLTGTTVQIHAITSRDLAKSQYAAHQVLVCLSEQNAMTMEIAVTIGNRVNDIGHALVDIQNDVSDLWNSLGDLASAAKSKLLALADRTATLERNQELLFWKETIEEREFNGYNYLQLNDIQKLICLASDFFYFSRGSWDYKDLIFLRSVMKEVGVDPKLPITTHTFFQAFIETPELQQKLLEINDLVGNELDLPLHAPLLAGINKIQTLNNDEHYLVESVADLLRTNAVEVDKKEITLNLTSKHLCQLTPLSTKSRILAYDLIVELLGSMEVLKSSPRKNDVSNQQNFLKKKVIESIAKGRELIRFVKNPGIKMWLTITWRVPHLTNVIKGTIVADIHVVYNEDRSFILEIKAPKDGTLYHLVENDGLDFLEEDSCSVLIGSISTSEHNSDLSD